MPLGSIARLVQDRTTSRYLNMSFARRDLMRAFRAGLTCRPQWQDARREAAGSEQRLKFLAFPVEGGGIDLKNLGRFFERRVLAITRRICSASISSRVNLPPSRTSDAGLDGVREIGDLDLLAIAQDHRPFDHIAQLAQISRPSDNAACASSAAAGEAADVLAGVRSKEMRDAAAREFRYRAVRSRSGGRRSEMTLSR